MRRYAEGADVDDDDHDDVFALPEPATVSFIIPALNEEACIESLLRQLSVLEPAPLEVNPEP